VNQQYMMVKNFGLAQSFYLISLILSVVVGIDAFLPNKSTALTTIDRLPIAALTYNLAKKPRYSLSNFSIGGVRANMAEDRVIEKLGKPRKIEEFGGCARTFTLEYDRITFSIGYPIWSADMDTLTCDRDKPKYADCVASTTLADRISFSRGPVWLVSTSNPRYQTDRGVRVGDDIAKASRIYNRIISPASNQKLGVLEYSETGEENFVQMNLRFRYQNSKIVRIEYDRYYNDMCESRSSAAE
jgi:hypothetical protein